VLWTLHSEEIAHDEDGNGNTKCDHPAGTQPSIPARSRPAAPSAATAKIPVVHDLGFLSCLVEMAIGVPVID
jgi:hypothetical protein